MIRSALMLNLRGTTSDMAILAATFASDRDLFLHSMQMQVMEDVVMPLVIRLDNERRKAALN